MESEYFEFIKVTRDDPLMQEIYRLRFKVYCDEWGFEKPEDHPTGLEVDEYDEHSVHFAAIAKRDRHMVGTVRIILDSHLGFPHQHHCIVDQGEQKRIVDKSPPSRPARMGEISRLAVSKDYRRRTLDNLLYEDQIHEKVEELIREKEARDAQAGIVVERRRQADMAIVMGLYTCLTTESRELQLTHWYVATVRALIVLLKRIGFQFEPIGPEIDYHGLRRPYLGYLRETLKGVPDLYRLYTAEA